MSIVVRSTWHAMRPLECAHHTATPQQFWHSMGRRAGAVSMDPADAFVEILTYAYLLL